MAYRIGISGWRYAPWRGDFYPAGLPQRRELEYASRQVTSIEINGSFYSLQRPGHYAGWRDQTPEDFVFAVKAPRYITHLKRLADVTAPLANFFASGVLALGPKLGPVLWQVPENLRFDAAVLDGFLRQLPRSAGDAAELAAGHDGTIPDERALTQTDDPARPIRHAFEFRSPTFEDPAAIRLLRDHGVACVLADSAGRWPMVDEVTADFVYVRLHGDRELYTSGYSAQALDRWAERSREWDAAGLDVHAYFDNDAKGFAPHDAIALLGRLEAAPQDDFAP